MEGTAAIFGAVAVTAWLSSLEGYGQFGSARGHGCALHAGNYSPAPFECLGAPPRTCLTYLCSHWTCAVPAGMLGWLFHGCSL